jgi:hypothetical protein
MIKNRKIFSFLISLILHFVLFLISINIVLKKNEEKKIILNSISILKKIEKKEEVKVKTQEKNVKEEKNNKKKTNIEKKISQIKREIQKKQLVKVKKDLEKKEQIQELKIVSDKAVEESIYSENIYKKNEKEKFEDEDKSIQIDIIGWKVDNCSFLGDQTCEIGSVVFEITIDSEGYIVGIKTLEKSISNSLEEFYKDQVLKFTFSEEKDFEKKNNFTKGIITFNIKYKNL